MSTAVVKKSETNTSFLVAEALDTNYLSICYPDKWISCGVRGKLQSLDYFNCQDFPDLEDPQYYGLKPKKFIVIFPSLIPEEFMLFRNSTYGSNKRSTVRCNGKVMEVTYDNCQVGSKYFNTGQHYSCQSPDCECSTELKFAAYIINPHTTGPEDARIYHRPIMFKSKQKYGGMNILTTLKTFNTIPGFPFILSVEMIQTNSRRYPQFRLEIPPDDFINKFKLPVSVRGGGLFLAPTDNNQLALGPAGSQDIELVKFNKLVKRIDECKTAEQLEELKSAYEEHKDGKLKFNDDLRDRLLQYFEQVAKDIEENLGVDDILQENNSLFPGLESTLFKDHSIAWKEYFEKHPEHKHIPRAEVIKKIKEAK